MTPARAVTHPIRRHSLDGILPYSRPRLAFDDTHAVANAGLLLPATPAQRLGIEQAADALIDLGNRPARTGPAASY